MDRSLVQMKQSRSCAEGLERIAVTAAKTTTRICVGLVRPLCDSRTLSRVRRPYRRTLGGGGIAGRSAVQLLLVRIRERRSAADIARSRGFTKLPGDRASATNDTKKGA